MKVLVGFFTTESNANIPAICTIKNYDISFGDDCVVKSKTKEVFEQEGVEAIGSIYANAAGAGVIERSAFEYIKSCFVASVKQHLNEIDGIYLHLHGASYVQEVGSGDFAIMKAIREVTGPYMPIAVVCDPHGNLTEEYANSCTILRSYRESPHTDADKTKKLVAKMLCDLIKDRQNIHAIYRKLPLILGGEQSVSTDEPVKTINEYMDEMEKDPRVRSVSWHVGYLRHDCPEAGCAVVVVPQNNEDKEYCEKKCDELYDYVLSKRKEFHYTGITAMPDEALKMALECTERPAFITDSGDNTTSGATGWNTFVLRQVLALDKLDKKVLFANITDAETVKKLMNYQDGEVVKFELGTGYDEMSAKVLLEAEILSKAKMYGNMWSGRDKVWGDIVIVKLVDKPVYISISTCNNSMTEKGQFNKAGLDWNDYDVVVVKQGYIFPDLKKEAKLAVMSLTYGSTPQDTRIIPFKLIMRPMYPIDEI